MEKQISNNEEYATEEELRKIEEEYIKADNARYDEPYINKTKEPIDIALVKKYRTSLITILLIMPLLIIADIFFSGIFGTQIFGLLFLTDYIIGLVFIVKLFNSMDSMLGVTYIILIIFLPPVYYIALIHTLIKSKKLIKKDK